MLASGIPLLAARLLLPADPGVLITRKGEKFEGTVSRDGADYVVETVTGPRRIPGADVALAGPSRTLVLRLEVHC